MGRSRGPQAALNSLIWQGPSFGRVVVRFVLVVAGRNDVGALEPAVEVDLFAAHRAERVGLTRRRLAASGAGPLGAQRRDFVVRAHDRPELMAELTAIWHAP